MPVTIGNDKISLETDVVDIDIPLLLSKATMKKSSTVIDFNKDTAMFGKQQPSVKTTSGHYAIPLTKRQQIVETCPTEEVQSVLIYTNNSPTKNEIIKLHRQFGHCSEQKLSKLIESAAIWEDRDETKKLITEVSEECVICKWYKKRKLRPIVSIPLASEFNHTVAMDLITYEQGTWILFHLFSRYSTACVRRSKKQIVVIDAVLKTWISYFGRPKSFLADNGGEFLNEEYKEMCEMFNIEEAKTAAESPWSNRICERQNAILKESVQKTIDESGCKLETAVV